MAREITGGSAAIAAEARKTKETAERMANGEGPPGDADDIRAEPAERKTLFREPEQPSQ